MHVQPGPGDLAKGFDYRWADCEIRHKVAIHDVHVEHFRSALFHPGYVFRKTGEVRREDRWNYLNQYGYVSKNEGRVRPVC
jgi:hypothetical protein